MGTTTTTDIGLADSFGHQSLSLWTECDCMSVPSCSEDFRTAYIHFLTIWFRNVINLIVILISVNAEIF